MLCGLDFFYYFITDALELPLVVRLLYAQTFLIMLFPYMDYQATGHCACVHMYNPY